MDYFSFSEIKTKIVGWFRSDLGININLSDTEPGGQLVNIGSSQGSDISDMVVDAYNANTMFATEDQDIEIQAARKGTRRILAKKARIYNFLVTCDGTGTIGTDKQIRDDQGNVFAPYEEYALAIGENRITLVAVTAGSIEIGENEVNTLISPVSGVVSVSNDEDSIFQNGRNLETTEELRTRLSTFSDSTVNTAVAIKQAVEELAYVSRATVIEDEFLNIVEVVVEQSDTS
ncbi:MAG TPA: baseplate J/gp47 family protein, partial [bacterium]|nr:baseplate J/gp47 family protein [bacterium]